MTTGCIFALGSEQALKQGARRKGGQTDETWSEQLARTFQPSDTYDTPPCSAPIAATPTAMITIGGIDSYGIENSATQADRLARGERLQPPEFLSKMVAACSRQ